MGTIITPMTMAADNALKMPTSSLMVRSSGVMKNKAKNPYTTVGTPASTSKMGLVMALNLGWAYSLRKIALSRPKRYGDEHGENRDHHGSHEQGPDPVGAGHQQGAPLGVGEIPVPTNFLRDLEGLGFQGDAFADSRQGRDGNFIRAAQAGVRNYARGTFSRDFGAIGEIQTQVREN